MGEGCEEIRQFLLQLSWWLTDQGAHRSVRWHGELGSAEQALEETGSSRRCLLSPGKLLLSDQKRNFQTPLHLREKKNKELYSVQLNTYVAQMLAGGLPTPQELCKISSNLHQFHDPQKSKSLPKTAPKSWGTEALRATLSSKVLLSELNLEIGSIDVTWELVMNVASVPTLRFRPTDSEPAFPQGPQVICVHGTVWEAWL